MDLKYFSSSEDLHLAVLFEKACGAATTCLLTQKWECNTLVSLSALELISGLAELNIEDIRKLKYLIPCLLKLLSRHVPSSSIIFCIVSPFRFSPLHPLCACVCSVHVCVHVSVCVVYMCMCVCV